MSWRNRSPKTLAHRWSLNGHADDLIRGQHGTLVNAPTWATNQFGKQCVELDGDNAHVNVGDVDALNAVPAFSLCFWMNQDVIDATDYIFVKQVDGNNRIIFRTDAGGLAYCIVGNGANTYAQFDYSLYISATSWHHVAIVFDGSQTGDANRLKVYIDGEPITLTFNGTIPTATANMSGIDATIGQASSSLDGKLFDFQLFSVALSRDEVNDVMRGHG